MREIWKLGLLVGGFALLYFVPLAGVVPIEALSPGLDLLHEYAREHVLTCLVPAFFIAGAIAVYLNKDAVLRYLGPKARPTVAYPIAAISGGILAVCSCTVLPLFAGIFKRGAGLGPAIAFVFTGPAINITAIFLTASVLGWHFAAYRFVAAMTIGIVAGGVLAAVFRDEKSTDDHWMSAPAVSQPAYSGGTVGIFLGSQVGLLIVLGIGEVPAPLKILLTIVAVGSVLGMAFQYFEAADRREWMQQTWLFTKQIMPYLFVGVFLAGMISALLPAELVAGLVGGNGMVANTVASVSGSLMYFATLTEIPILESLLRLGMGSGPAMALLLTGNALSVPNLIVLNKILGVKKTLTYLALVVAMSIGAGAGFGVLVTMK